VSFRERSGSRSDATRADHTKQRRNGRYRELPVRVANVEPNENMTDTKNGRGIFGCCICHPTNLLDKSCDRTSAACPATGQRTPARLAMDHGLRLRDRQHDSRRNPGFALQLNVSKLARDQANCSGALYGAGAGVAINAGWRIACPISNPVACAGSARSGYHRHSDLRSTHRASFRKSQIVHRRQTFLSSGASLNVR
jgi:hypothetical protein